MCSSSENAKPAGQELARLSEKPLQQTASDTRRSRVPALHGACHTPARKQPRFPASQGPGAPLSSWGGTRRGRGLCSILPGPLSPRGSSEAPFSGGAAWTAAGLQESKGRLPGLSGRGRASLGSHPLPPPRQPLGKEATRRPVDGEAAGRAHRPGGGERGLLGQGRTASAATGTGVAVSRRPLPPQRSPRRAAGLSGRRAEHSGAGRSGAGRGGRQPHHVHASAKAAHQPLSSRQVLHPQPGDDSTTSQGLIRTKCAHARTHAHAHTHSFKEHAGTGPACSERCLLFAAAGVTR